MNYAATHNTSGGAISAKHKDQLAANDVKWSHGQFDSTIATAAANGQIVIYDVNRADVESARLHEHSRQVHRLAFNPYNGALLVSGSQDATVRLWDLRTLAGERSVMSFGSATKYSLNNEGIRDLRWSPKDEVEFAAGTDNGVVQRWDFRKHSSPMLKISAHEKTCHTIDWHPDGKHLASGGADKNVKVWDFSSTDRRMKVCWQIRAPQAIREVRWRPSCFRGDNQALADSQCTQLATSYDHQDARIHVWDFRRSFIPIREIDSHETPATAMLWRSEDLLWSVGSKGIFSQTDINHSSRVLDSRSPNVVAIASEGNISLFSEKRAERRRSVDEMPNDFLHGRPETGSSGERISGCQDVTGGSFEEPSMLSSSFKIRQRRAPMSRSKSIASTPPSANDGEVIRRLDELLQSEYIYHPTQSSASGTIIGVFDAEAFKFLARNYRFPPMKPSPHDEWNLHKVLPKLFEDNATLAAYVGQHRLAQSWRILGLALGKDLKSRAEQKQAARLHRSEPPDGIDQELHRTGEIKSRTPSVFVKGQSIPENSLQDNLVAPLIIENGSNVTTPLARPISDTPSSVGRQQSTAVLDDGETFRLPKPAFTKQSPRKHLPISSDLTKLKNSMEIKDSKPGVENEPNPRHVDRRQHGHGQTPPATGFLDLDHRMSERRAAMTNYRVQPRPLLRLDDPFYIPQAHLTPSLGRHDSDESFQMFSASTSSSYRNSSMGGSFGSSPGSRESGSSPERTRQGSRRESEGSPESEANPDIWFGGEHSHDDPEGYVPHTNMAQATVMASDVPQNSPSAVMITTSRPMSSKPAIINFDDFAYTKSRNAGSLILYLAAYMPMSVPPALMLAILLSYHEQLISLSLYCQAAHLRNLVQTTHPEISDHGTYGITPGGPWCTVCQKPSKGDRENFCERCKDNWAPCPICNGEGLMEPSRTEEPRTGNPSGDNVLWGWCQGCGHGGHLGCLRTWWDDPAVSEGGCATMGCLHDCVAGMRRDEMLRKAAEDRKTGLVKGDEWVVGESKAVEKARDLIGGGSPRGGRRGQAGARGRNVGQVPFSTGLGGRSGSGNSSISKKVRLLVPHRSEEDDREVTALVEAEDRTSVSAP